MPIYKDKVNRGWSSSRLSRIVDIKKFRAILVFKSFKTILGIFEVIKSNHLMKEFSSKSRKSQGGVTLDYLTQLEWEI